MLRVRHIFLSQKSFKKILFISFDVIIDDNLKPWLIEVIIMNFMYNILVSMLIYLMNTIELVLIASIY